MKRPVFILPVLYSFFFILAKLEATGEAIFEHVVPNEDPSDIEHVCVTLEKYETGCRGRIQSSNTFSALTKPGSPCKHTSKMKNNSAKDQYCTIPQTGKTVFHQTVYVHNTECKVGWAEKAISPMKLTYTNESCTYGYQLKSCTLGPCQQAPGVSDELERKSDEVYGDIQSVARKRRGDYESK
jgi:hypothetical protein